MNQVWAYSIVSVLFISILSLIMAIPFFLKKKISKHTLLFLLSISVGVLLSTVFMDLIPESLGQGHDDDALMDEHLEELEHLEEEFENNNSEVDIRDEDGQESENKLESHIVVSLYIILGFLIMFVVEKFIHWHHSKKECDHDCGHSHAYNLAPINLIGDGIHNLIDGLVIAGAYSINITLGLVATISVIFHEIPQEIADFGVLLYSGLSKKKAVLFNLLSALTSLIGVILGLVLLNKLHWFEFFIIPFAAGNFLYIAASNLLPQLHRHCKLKETFMHILAILIGVGIIFLITVYGPAHLH
ncbi:ZIP family metal transporter [Candidatus Woesearchaeota archaeon]|nr:ZIP family metal transporter [Candidatus Woesearchaeota archaeon]